MKKLVVATSNKGKAREIEVILGSLVEEVVTLADYPEIVMPPETAPDFRGNALAKARFVAGATGLPALADDSGLEVDALGGRPGVYSARYAGPGATDADNWRKLLSELEGVPAPERTARFRCAVAYVEPGGVEVVFEGKLEGEIGTEARGEGGFGYDPVFLLPERGLTTAELSSEEKHAVSHRAAAARAALPVLERRLGEASTG